MTEDMREKLVRTALEFEAIMSPDTDAIKTSITLLGTPQSEETVYKTFRERGYDCVIWPSRVPTPDKREVYGTALAESIQRMFDEGRYSEPTDPLRFNERELTERQASYGMSAFTLQFMLDTSLSDAQKYPLKLSDLIVMPLNSDKAPVMVQYGSAKEQQLTMYRNLGFTGDRLHKPLWFDKDNWASYEGSVMFVDPSGRGMDQTGYAVVKQLHGYLFATDVGGFYGGYDENTLIQLAKVAAREKVNLIIIESNFGDGMFSKLFQPILHKYHKCRIEEQRASKQKELRIIDILEPVMNRHKLILDDSVVRKEIKMVDEDSKQLSYNLFYQMTRLTKDKGALKHDDKLDALAGACEYWLESMSRDEKEAVDGWKTQQLEQYKDDFLGQILGTTQNIPENDNWLTNI